MARAQQLIGRVSSPPPSTGGILRTGRQVQSRTATPLRSPITSTGNTTTSPNLQQPISRVSASRPLPSIDGDRQINNQIPVGIAPGGGALQSTVAPRPVQPLGASRALQLPTNDPRKEFAQKANERKMQQLSTQGTGVLSRPDEAPGASEAIPNAAVAGGSTAITRAPQQKLQGPLGTDTSALSGRLSAVGAAQQQPTAIPTTAGQVPPPTPLTQAPEQPGAIGLENLSGVIERGLGTPSAFGSEQIDALRKSFRGEQEAQFQQGVEGLDIDAARRGVFHSTVPTAGQARLRGEQARATTAADANFAAQAAFAQDAGRRDIIGQALQFGGQQQQGQQFQDQLAAQLAELSGRGGPSGDVAATNIAGLGGEFARGRGGGIDPAVMNLISQMFGRA